MERELWLVLDRTVQAVARDFPQKYVQTPGWVLRVTLLWAALHDRPLSWAGQPAHWKTHHIAPPAHPFRLHDEPAHRPHGFGPSVARRGRALAHRRQPTNLAGLPGWHTLGRGRPP
jgi:hypothetical protein